MANRTAEEILMENKILRKICFPCTTCLGTGLMRSGKECPTCEGFNARTAKEALDER